MRFKLILSFQNNKNIFNFKDFSITIFQLKNDVSDIKKCLFQLLLKGTSFNRQLKVIEKQASLYLSLNMAKVKDMIFLWQNKIKSFSVILFLQLKKLNNGRTIIAYS